MLNIHKGSIQHEAGYEFLNLLKQIIDVAIYDRRLMWMTVIPRRVSTEECAETEWRSTTVSVSRAGLANAAKLTSAHARTSHARTTQTVSIYSRTFSVCKSHIHLFSTLLAQIYLFNVGVTTVFNVIYVSQISYNLVSGSLNITLLTKLYLLHI